MSPDVVLQLDDVEVVFASGARALHPTRLDFRDGELTVLLGPSGAGKSTLLRTLNGLVTPSRGRISAAGIGEIRNRARLRCLRRGTGMVFQHHQLIGRLSALDNVLTGRLAHHPSLRTLWPLPRTDRLIALECLDRVGLLDRALTRADQLSGGQQQRVGIARALAQQPRLILADEPIASLDPANAERILALLTRVCAENRITAIVSLHQLEFARRYAQRIVGLAHGHVVFDGAPHQLGDAEIRRIYDAAPFTAAPPPAPTVDPPLLKVENFR